MANINFANQENLEKKNKMSSANNILIPAVILFACLAVYGGVYIWKKSLDSKIAQVNSAISQEAENAKVKKFDSVFDFQARMDTASSLLKTRYTFSGDLSRIEKLIIPEVRLTSLDYDSKDSRMKLSAVAGDYHSIARQLNVLKESADITGLKLEDDNIKRTEEGITFQFSFNFK